MLITDLLETVKSFLLGQLLVHCRKICVNDEVESHPESGNGDRNKWFLQDMEIESMASLLELFRNN